MDAHAGRMVSHYRLEQRIGRGGMGVVWRAQDTVLERPVAIKVLPSRMSHELHCRERFLEEARLAATVSHAHIVQVFEVGTEGDLDFIVMEFVEGQSLDRIIRGRPLPIDKVSRWGHQIADGLGRAHRKGLVHRDLKPANVLINTEDDVKIVDFGLATLFECSDTTQSQTTLSGHGVIQEEPQIAGTLPYMSPEQIGGKVVDARSDIFSLGSLLYEMTTGRMPFTGSSPQEIRGEILRDQPIPVHELRPDVPLELDRIIDKAMDRRRSRRYQTMGDLAVDLERLSRSMDLGSAPSYASLGGPPPRRPRRGAVVTAAIVLVTAGLAGWLGHWISDDGPQVALPPSRVVAGAENTLFERGKELWETAETLRATDDAIQMLHRALAEDPSNPEAWALLGRSYWWRYYKWTPDATTRQAADHAVEEAGKLAPDSPVVLTARGYGAFVLKQFDAARADLEHALAIDSTYAEAWSCLGRVFQEKRDYASGLRARKMAVQLDPDSYRYHLMLGFFHQDFSEEEAAELEYQEALRLNPRSKSGWNNLAAIYLKTNRPEKAIQPLMRSLEIEETASAEGNLGTAYYFLGMFEQAAKHYVKATLLEPEESVHWGNLGDALQKLGKDECQSLYQAAARLARDRTRVQPQDAYAQANLGWFCAKAGMDSCSIPAAERAIRMRPRDPQLLLRAATTFLVEKHPEAGFEYLEKAVRFGATRAQILNDPDLAAWQDDERYRRILDLAS